MTYTIRTVLLALDDALQQFHHHREIFHTSGICTDGFNLPRQHSLIHYVKLIRAFGAPNGLCSSITESKHIKFFIHISVSTVIIF